MFGQNKSLLDKQKKSHGVHQLNKELCLLHMD